MASSLSAHPRCPRALGCRICFSTAAMHHEGAEMSRWLWHGIGMEEYPFTIAGVDVWREKLRRTDEYVRVKEPAYDQEFEVQVQELVVKGRVIRIAITEIAPGRYGLWAEDFWPPPWSNDNRHESRVPRAQAAEPVRRV